MKKQDYKAILRALDQAIEICDQSSGFMDETHHKICEELRAVRGRLLSLGGPSDQGMTTFTD
jgi:hypothetical protein